MPITMSEITVATDLSERSERALRRAAMLAAATGAKLNVVSVVDDALPDMVAGKLSGMIEAHLAALVPDLGVDVAIEVCDGDPAAEIAAYVNGGKTDLVVLGLHRARTILDGFRQTTMERIIIGSRRPVLLATTDADGAYRKALLPVSFSPSCTAAMAMAHRVAPEAEFVAYHAWMVPFGGMTGGPDSSYAEQVRREVTEEAASWAKGLPWQAEPPELVQGSVHEALDRMIASHAPDLIAIGANTRSGPALHRLGGFAAELIRNPPRDLLVSKARFG